jgi:uncharacterized membrane protein
VGKGKERFVTSIIRDAKAKLARPSLPIEKHRVDALTDGVMAIAMTLFVLDVKVPDLPTDVPPWSLMAALGHTLPTFASFVLSFVVLGVAWYRHH